MQKNGMDLSTKYQITLYLGSQCNLHCAYCHREASDGEGEIAESFLEELKCNPPSSIKFMGGEPLLYMKEIRKVVAAVPKAKFAVSTNGIGIEKHLEYFREHGFQICISYDGAEKDLRGYDPFTALWDYPDVAVSTTLYHGNTDMGAIMAKFREKEKVIGRNLSFFPHLMHVTNEANRKYALTREDYDSLLDQYKKYVGLYLSRFRRFGIRDKRYEGLYQTLDRRREARYTYGETYCSNRTIQKVDAKGRQYPCLYIRRQELSDNWLKEQQDLLDALSPECRQCSVYGMCGGACIVSQEHAQECRFYKALYTWFQKEVNRP
jgi:radical SAM protein with 4Fe4S-binding SPASM domain